VQQGVEAGKVLGEIETGPAPLAVVAGSLKIVW